MHLRPLLLVAVLLLCVNFVSCEGFNFDVARRTSDAVRNFLKAAYYPAAQVAKAFDLDLLDTTSPQFHTKARTMLFSLMNSVVQIGQLQVIASDKLVAITRSDSLLISTEPMLPNGCQQTHFSPQNLCVNVAEMDLQTNTYLFSGIRNTSSALAAFPADFAAQQSGAWSFVKSLSTNAIGIQYTQDVFQSNQQAGQVSVGILLNNLDEFLTEAFGQEEDNRVVFVVDRKGQMVAASVPGITTKVVGGQLVQVNATECEHSLVRESSKYLFSLDDLASGELHVHAGFYVQSTAYQTTGIDWLIVVVRPIDMHNDYISKGSDTYVFICCCISLCIFCSCILLVWLLRFFKLRLWKAAQPAALVLVLVSNLLCGAAAFVLLGKPSNTICVVRQWTVSLSVTLTCAALLAKLLRVFLATNVKLAIQRLITSRLKERDVALIVCAVCAVQFGLLLAWTVLDPFQATMRYETEVGVVFSHEVCASSSIVWPVTCAAFVCLLVVMGCYLSFVTRNLSPLFAESRALMLIFFHGSFITATLLIVGVFASVNTKSMTLFVVMSLLWFGATTQAVLFLPRIYRQVTLGDFSLWEMKQVLVQHLHRTNSPDSKAVAVFGRSPDQETRTESNATFVI